MKITIESTEKIVELELSGSAGLGVTKARVWQGVMINGDGAEDRRIPVQVFVIRIAPEVTEDDPRFAETIERFGLELCECAKPRPAVEAIPLRMII